MSSTTLTVLSVLLAVIVIAVLAGALIAVQAKLRSTAEKLATLAGALESVQSEHLHTLRPAVEAINEQFDVIVGALPSIAAKAAVVAERRPS
ncbi:MAG: hypothetical protein ACYCXW_14410 [Solirubrobacteraceae bacterium]